MYAFTIHAVDRNIAFEVNYPQSRKFCEQYLTDGSADWTFRIEADDLSEEKENLEKLNLRPPKSMGPAYFEVLAMHRKLSLKFLTDNVLLFHGSCIAVDGAAYLFMAESGTGKSTHAKIWREVLGKDHDIFMVNDDKPYIRVNDNSVYVYGSPWDGKHHLSTDVGVPLAGIALLERSDNNTIEPMPQKKDMRDFFSGVFIPRDPGLKIKALGLLDTILYRTPCYRLGCNMSPEAAVVSYNGMCLHRYTYRKESTT